MAKVATYHTDSEEYSQRLQCVVQVAVHGSGVLPSATIPPSGLAVCLADGGELAVAVDGVIDAPQEKIGVRGDL